jgi:hypothetical protein
MHFLQFYWRVKAWTEAHLALHTKNVPRSTLDKITRKANSTLTFLGRNVSRCPTIIKAQCYTTLVRITLEYGPQQKKTLSTRLRQYNVEPQVLRVVPGIVVNCIWFEERWCSAGISTRLYAMRYIIAVWAYGLLLATSMTFSKYETIIYVPSKGEFCIRPPQPTDYPFVRLKSAAENPMYLFYSTIIFENS